MKDNYHFIAISGSLRKNSYNTMVLKAAQKMAPSNIVIEHLSIADVPMYNFDLHEKFYPEPVEKLCTAIKAADAVIIVTPEYNYSIPGVLKNVIDFLSKHTLKPYDKKAVGIISASPSLLGGVRAQYHLRQILVAVNAMTMNVPEVVITEVNKKFDETGNLTDEKTKEFLKKFIDALAVHSSILSSEVLI
ncbi:MAG: NADPH-dependent FMN reductase [Bacteroidota bacterium]|nr:NADPH-dependent FMN reductase [Bacteroidota bacterium]